jgi:hypothetical protein
MSFQDEVRAALTRIEASQARIELKLAAVLAEEQSIMAAIDDLEAEVAQDTTVEQSAITLIDGIAAQIAAAGTDPTRLAAVQATLANNRTALAAAVAANTPAAPPAPAAS